MKECQYHIEFSIESTKASEIYREFYNDVKKLLEEYVSKHKVKKQDFLRLTVNTENLIRECSTSYHRGESVFEMLDELLSRAKHVSNSDGTAYEGELELKLYHIKAPSGGGREKTDLRVLTEKHIFL